MKKEEIIKFSQRLLKSKIVIVKRGEKEEFQLQTMSGEMLFNQNPQHITLLRSQLEYTLKKELNTILKGIKRIRIVERKELLKEMIAFINQRLINPETYIHFPGELDENEKWQLESFKNIILRNSHHTVEAKKQIWNRSLNQTYRERLIIFLKDLELQLLKISFRLPKVEMVCIPNPFELALGEETEERVRKLYRALKKSKYILGGSEKAFVALFTGEQISLKNKFDLRFDASFHAYHFFNGMKDKQDSIVFPPRKKNSPDFDDRAVPWTFLNQHFTNWGAPLIEISTHSKDDFPDYLNELIKILRRFI